MGERERRDSQRVLEGKPIRDIKSFSLIEFLLYPYRAWKEKKRREEIKKSMFLLLDEEEAMDEAFDFVEKSNKEEENKGDK